MQVEKYAIFWERSDLHLRNFSVVCIILSSAHIKCSIHFSIAENCFDIWGILKMASVKSVEPESNSFSINHIIRCRSKLLPLGFSKFVLVLIL